MVVLCSANSINSNSYTFPMLQLVFIHMSQIFFFKRDHFGPYKFHRRGGRDMYDHFRLGLNKLMQILKPSVIDIGSQRIPVIK